MALASLCLGHPDLIAYATDVSEAALECTRRNGELNAVSTSGAKDRLRAALPWEVPRRINADVGMANMLPGPLISVAPELAARLRPGALLMLTGFRENDRRAVCGALANPTHPALPPTSPSHLAPPQPQPQ